MAKARLSFAPLLRLLIVAVIALGLGLPALANPQLANPQSAEHAHAHHQLMQADPMATLHQTPDQTPMDETCRQHCLGVAVLATTQAIRPASRVIKPVEPILATLTHPSLTPAPEGHPPRA